MAKYIYIKHDIKGFYAEFGTPLTDGFSLGTTWDDFVNNKWVQLGNAQVAFREANPTAKIHEVWNMELDPVHVRDLSDAKSEKISAIEGYDNSDNVNGFEVNGVTAWLTADERSNYKNSVESAKLLGLTEVSFYVGDALLTVSVEQATLLLAQLQLYADQCFIVTKQHKAAVNALTTIESVDAYDYTTGYPEKISVEIQA